MDIDSQAKPIYPPFHFAQICLKPLTAEVLSETLRWRNFYKDYFNDNREITYEKHLSWYQSYVFLTTDLVFIAENRQGEKVGQTAIYHIEWEKCSAEFGRVVVNPSFAGKGYMKQACQATLLLAKQILGIHSLHLCVKSTNYRAIQLYKACGFLTMGTDESHNDNITMLFQ